MSWLDGDAADSYLGIPEETRQAKARRDRQPSDWELVMDCREMCLRGWWGFAEGIGWAMRRRGLA